MEPDTNETPTHQHVPGTWTEVGGFRWRGCVGCKAWEHKDTPGVWRQDMRPTRRPPQKKAPHETPILPQEDVAPIHPVAQIVVLFNSLGPDDQRITRDILRSL